MFVRRYVTLCAAATEEPATIRPTALSRLQLRFENGIRDNPCHFSSDVDFIPPPLIPWAAGSIRLRVVRPSVCVCVRARRRTFPTGFSPTSSFIRESWIAYGLSENWIAIKQYINIKYQSARTRLLNSLLSRMCTLIFIKLHLNVLNQLWIKMFSKFFFLTTSYNCIVKIQFTGLLFK